MYCCTNLNTLVYFVCLLENIFYKHVRGPFRVQLESGTAITDQTIAPSVRVLAENINVGYCCD